jgi:hypothetical protein
MKTGSNEEIELMCIYLLIYLFTYLFIYSFILSLSHLPMWRM